MRILFSIPDLWARPVSFFLNPTRDMKWIGNGGVSGLIYVTIVVTPRCGGARAPSAMHAAGMLYAVRYS